ncbi:MAG: OmpA/MotB family protein [Planctomycetota bacterium]|jgi:chemotaxis protein MotB
MLAFRPLIAALALGALAVSSGCILVPKARLNELNARTVALSEQNRAQKTLIENLKVHSRNMEDQLMRTEEDLALLEEQTGLDQRRLANYREERDQLYEHVSGLFGRGGPIPARVRRQLAEISQKYPALQIDPNSGAGKLDTDVLFDVGKAELKPGAEDALRTLVRVMNRPEARDLKILVVGHTDDRLVAAKPVREKYPNNFHLSAHRALTVCDELRRLGLGPERMGVAGFGPHQPVAPNMNGENREKNRRVELFVMAPEVPVIGWTETTPHLY